MSALKRGLNTRAHELGIHVCGGRGNIGENASAPACPASNLSTAVDWRLRLTTLPLPTASSSICTVRASRLWRMGHLLQGMNHGSPASHAVIIGVQPGCDSSANRTTHRQVGHNQGTILNLVDLPATPARDGVVTIRLQSGACWALGS